MYLFWWHLKSKWVCGWFNSAPVYEACVHRDALEVLGEGNRRDRSVTGQRQTRLWRLCYTIWLLGGPELFVLLASEALVIVSFAFEQLLEVGFAVKFALKSCKAAKAEFGIAVLAAETCWMEDKVVCNQFLHWVDCLLTWCAHFLLSSKAEGLRSLDRFFFRGVSGVHLRFLSATHWLITRSLLAQ